MTKICVYVGNHQPTDEQLTELEDKWGCEKTWVINPLPLPPNETSSKIADQIVSELIKKIRDVNAEVYLWVQFPQVDLKLVHEWTKEVKPLRKVCGFLLPMTERKVEETKLSNGSVKKTSIFQHKGFIKVL